MKTLNVFVPAAGFGERLRPITDHLPKPLLPILGKPVIEIILERIMRLPIEKVGINMHYKWQMLRDWARMNPCSEKIRLFLEDPILGTGGALTNASSLLKGSTFFVHNSDVISDIDLEILLEAHLRSGNIVTLAVHDYHRFNNVWVDGKGCIRSIGMQVQDSRKGERRVAFTGIAAYSPRFLDHLPPGQSSVVDSWIRASSAGEKVGTVDFTGCRWTDIGTPGTYSSIVFETMQRGGETLYIHPSVECPGLYPGPNSVIEKGCLIEGQAEIRESILLQGARIGRGAVIHNSIVGPGYVVPLPASRSVQSLSGLHVPDFPGDASGKQKISLIGTGGSDRKYYRIREEKSSAVLMECSSEDPDYRRQLLYTGFFRRHSVPVPALISSDPRQSSQPLPAREGFVYALFEDLGDFSLYSWLKCRRTPESVEALYKKILDILSLIHVTATNMVSECPPLESRIFDYGHLRWETDYFRERFVSGLLGIVIKEREELDREFDRLARVVDTFGKTIVHRDFQSQNIMITEGDIPRIIDYQGARMGPPAYDLASLLWDPYHHLDEEMRKRLIEHYMLRRKDLSAQDLDEAGFIRTILPCRLQRHMQALGAYGFLSKVKGKKYFTKHIPQALRYLRDEVEAVHDECPALCRLVRKIDEKIED